MDCWTQGPQFNVFELYFQRVSSWSSTVLSLHHGYQTFPLAAPSAIIFFPTRRHLTDAATGVRRAYFGAMRRAVLSLCYHDAKFISIFSIQLETFRVIGDSDLQELWQQPSTSLSEHYVLAHNYLDHWIVICDLITASSYKIVECRKSSVPHG